MKWLSENLEWLTTLVSLIIAAIGWYLKNRATLWTRCKLKITEAIEKAELLKNATGEQKKEYAMALVTAVYKKIKESKISEEMEKQIQLTKNVNVKKQEREEY